MDSESEMPSLSALPISLAQIWVINTSTWTLKSKFLKAADFEIFQDNLGKQTLNYAMFMILSLTEVLGNKLGVPFSKMYLCQRIQRLWEVSRYLQELCYFSLLQLHDGHHQSNQSNQKASRKKIKSLVRQTLVGVFEITTGE